MSKAYPIIDLFAGPGGLGEGFNAYSSYRKDSKLSFDIALSVEKDPAAHKTLELRSFYRQFPDKKAPGAYYAYLNGTLSRQELFEQFPRQADAAREEAWLHELSEGDIDEVVKRATDACNKKKYGGNPPIVIGGPPCQAYSLVGRSRMQSTRDDFDEDPRHFLYRHYLRIVASLNPVMFVMENVKGLLSAKICGEFVFDQIVKDLRHPSESVKQLDKTSRRKPGGRYEIYALVQGDHADDQLAMKRKPSDYVIRAEDYGIPQTRHRVILFGVRKDIDPELRRILTPARETVTVADVIGDLPRLRSTLSKEADSSGKWVSAIRRGLEEGVFNDVSKGVAQEIRKTLSSLPDGFSPGAVRCTLPRSGAPRKKMRWYRRNCSKLKVTLNHESRGHMTSDLWRYLYSSCYARLHKQSPNLSNYPHALLPDHKNVNHEDLKATKFVDRFKVQIENAPSSTVTSHISKDGHYFIHCDPEQCRALTVREAARLQTFPDNYFFEGNRTQQYHQVGNAVPPLLALQIADIVAENLKKMSRKKS